MTRPTARVLALLEILQRGGTRTVAELAGRLGVDERTVRRYVAHLVDLEIPVRSVRGRYGGYVLAPGFRLPPLMLTDDEALAVLLGLIGAQRSGLVTGVVGAVESATSKVRRVLPTALERRLDALLATTEITGPPHPESRPPESEVVLALAEAARDRRPIGIEYLSHDGRHSERTLHPYGIVAHDGRWYVTGEDSSSGEVRTFRVDRIRRPRVLPGEFAVPSGFDPTDQVLTGLAGVPRGEAVSVRVQGTTEHVRARLPAGVATVDDLPDEAGWVRVRLVAVRLDWVPGALAGLDRPFVIEQPEALRTLVHDLALRLADSADALPNPGG